MSVEQFSNSMFSVYDALFDYSKHICCHCESQNRIQRSFGQNRHIQVSAQMVHFMAYHSVSEQASNLLNRDSEESVGVRVKIVCHFHKISMYNTKPATPA